LIDKNNLVDVPFPIFTAMGKMDLNRLSDLTDPLFWKNEEWYEFTPISVQTCRSREEKKI